MCAIALAGATTVATAVAPMVEDVALAQSAAVGEDVHPSWYVHSRLSLFLVVCKIQSINFIESPFTERITHRC